MKAAIVSTTKQADLDLLLQLAKKLGLDVNMLSKHDIEDLQLVNAIEKGRTKKYVNTKSFLKKLKNEGQN